MKKWSLRQKRRIMNGMFVAGLPLFGVAVMFNDRVLWLPFFVGLGMMITALALQFKWWRCPCCHTYLDRLFNPNFCPHCGEKIDYDAKEE